MWGFGQSTGFRFIEYNCETHTKKKYRRGN
jgi:hypothetical protein